MTLPSVHPVIRWVFGLVFILVGMANFSHPFAAIVSLLIAAILIPPTMNFIQKRMGHTLARKYKVTALVVMGIVLMIALPDGATADPNQVIPAQDLTPTQHLQTQVNDQILPIEVQPKIDESTPDETKQQEQSASSSAAVSAANLSPTPQVETPKPKAVAPKSSCDPNYSGCVPIASDVDCVSGSGNGPAYTGRTTVIGTDIYDLDRDGDGVACE